MIAKYRDAEHPNRWWLTDFTMEQVEGKLAALEADKQRWQEIAMHLIKVWGYDRLHWYCCGSFHYCDCPCGAKYGPFEQRDETLKCTNQNCPGVRAAMSAEKGDDDARRKI